MVSIHDLPAVERVRRSLKIDAYHVRRVRNAFCKKQQSAAVALGELPPDKRAAFAAAVQFHALRLASRHDSRLDGATKLVLATWGNLRLEAVLLRMTTGRSSVCVSTQVGCAASCEFCATGKMGIIRNLSAFEILDQVVHANALLAAEGRKLRNVVFMGMGEPFHNEGQLYQAIDVLCDPCGFDLHCRRLLVSTVGIAPALVRCAMRYRDVRLAVSLHSARQDVRRRLMPVAGRYSLAELREAMEEASRIQQHPIMIEYLLLADLNDTPRDAEALVEYLRGIPVHVNLIRYNPIAGAPHLAASDRARHDAFSQALKAAGYPVTTRYSLGADIAAACGQLVRQEHRRRGKPRLKG